MGNSNCFIDIMPGYPGKVVDAFKDKLVDTLIDINDCLKALMHIVDGNTDQCENYINRIEDEIYDLREMMDKEYMN